MSLSALDAILRERRLAAMRAEERPPHAVRARHGYNPNQPRVPGGQPDGGQWTNTGHGWHRQSLADREANQRFSLSGEVLSDGLPELPRVWTQYAEARSNTGPQDPAIESTHQTLLDILISVNSRANRFAGSMSPTQYGTYVHVEFANAVRSRNLPGIGTEGVEQSFDADGLNPPYGTYDTIRTDIILRNRAGRIIAVFDVKTGDAIMNPAREAKIRAYTHVGPDIPLFILRAQRGAGRK